MAITRNITQYIKEYKSHNFEEIQVKYRRKKILERISLYSHKNILEIGCGFEPIFKYIDDFDTMTIVEPGMEFVENVKNISKGDSRIKCIYGFFEDVVFELSLHSYDFIIVSGLLHELENIDKFLEALKIVISAKTVVHVNVPNAYSLHRILAEEMGLIKDVFQKSETQIKLQQFSTFSINSLKGLLEGKQFKIIESGSYFVKPFTHQQMYNILVSDIIDMNVLDGLYKLTKYLPEYGSEIFVDCKI
jgi:2-polyprenyl-3-methyl-5-hydroxy-6-metoxy-1,4-benzoquinol methylase